jgi:hypothetical protein
MELDRYFCPIWGIIQKRRICRNLMLNNFSGLAPGACLCAGAILSAGL